MDTQTIKDLILAKIPDAQVSVSGENGKYEALVVSAQFAGCRTVKRHQMVYAACRDKIQSGEVHALAIKTQTPDESAL